MLSNALMLHLNVLSETTASCKGTKAKILVICRNFSFMPILSIGTNFLPSPNNSLLPPSSRFCFQAEYTEPEFLNVEGAQ
jgi:hypothetical protein